ncbi:MAG: hypothetical protein ACRD2C_27835 [Acidimicrobiales bacterium]
MSGDRALSHRGRGLLVLPLLGLAVALGACGDDDSADARRSELSRDAVIEYRYGDSSVPPEFHRTYTLTIQPDEVHVVVDSYGDVLQDTTEPVPAEVWDDLAGNVDDLEQLDVDAGDDGCDGGTSRSIRVSDQGHTVVDTEFGVCGDANDEAADQVDSFVQPVVDSIPDWDRLIE